MSEVKYFLIPGKETLSVERDFDRMVAHITRKDPAEVKTSGEIDLTYEVGNEKKYSSKLQIITPGVGAGEGVASGKKYIQLTTSRSNSFSIQSVREACNVIGYRVYSVELGCFLSKYLAIRDLVTFSLPAEDEDMLLKKGYEPVFVSTASGKYLIIYAREKESGGVHIINPYLMEYYRLYGIDEEVVAEFSYEVVPGIAKFSAYMDAFLVPIDYYEGYGKREKIFNHSYFNIDNPGRKVFVKPLVYELDSSKGEFYTRVGEKGSIILMDKILPGERLAQTIARFLRENEIADSFIGAFVDKHVEFDRDREGRLTPRLIVFVYVEKIKSIPDKLKRSWRSNDTKPEDVSYVKERKPVN